MTSITVYPIQDPSNTVCTKDQAEHHYVGICNSPFTSYLYFGGDEHTTIHHLKRSVEHQTGIPPERQRYYGVSRSLKGVYRFNTPEILRNDDGPVVQHLRLARDAKHTKLVRTVGVVFLPASLTLTDEGDDEQPPRIVREVDTVAERIAAGRATAIEIGDDSGSEDDDDDDEEDAGAPRPKRQRRDESKDLEDTDEEDNDEGDNSDEEDGVATAAAAAIVADDRDVADGEDEENEARDEAAALAEDHDDPEQQAEGAEDDDNDVGKQTGGADGEQEIDVAVNAAVVEAAAEARAAAGRDAAPSPLRQWLRSLDATGSNTGRFERYAPSLELEFDSLADLALVPGAEAQNGWGELFEACGVGRVGDRLRLKRAIGSLPPPPE